MRGAGRRRGRYKHGVTRQRCYQVLKLFEENGALALQNQKRGPKTNYVRTDEVKHRSFASTFSIPTPRLTSSPRSFARLVSPSAPGASNV